MSLRKNLKKFVPIWTGVACCAMGCFYSCNDGYELIDEDPSWLGSSIYDYLKSNGNYTNVVRMIDEFPAFMIAAACAQGETLVRDAAELRAKESDRIAIMAAALRALGVDIEEYSDGFRIRGTGRIPGGATLDAHGDHRVAMSLALAALVAEHPVAIQGFDILSESFPDFPRVLAL